MAVDERFQSQAETFITETIKAEIPSANVDGGSGLNTLVARAGGAISAALLQEIDHVLTTRDLTDPEALPEEDMNRVLENLLTERDSGDRSFGFLRLFYNERTIRSFAANTVAQTEDSSLNFVTLIDQTFGLSDYFIDADTGQLFINVAFAGESPGEKYNVDPGDITKLVNVSDVPLRVTNFEAFRNGKSSQTNEQALRKASRAVSTRTPVAKDALIFFLQELFGTKLIDVLVIGFGDDEMLRDEVYDLGVPNIPQFQIGKDGIGGVAQDVHVGGRTDVYSLFSNVNYVQQVIDIFADMTLDAGIGGPVGFLDATVVTGTTGTVATTGKIIIDIGEANEETIAYTDNTPNDGVTYTFTLVGTTVNLHDAGATVKVVNNQDLSIGPGLDITTLPLFLMAEVHLLDPITLEPVGDPLPEVTPNSREPGWYISGTNPFDIFSARETKTLVVDEKRSTAGNLPLSNINGSTVDEIVGSTTFTKYTNGAGGFTGYQGRAVTLNNGTTISNVDLIIFQVISDTEILVGNVAVEGSGVDFTIDSGFGDFNQFPVRVSYYTNTEVEEIQDFLDQDRKRTITSDFLSRTFLPVLIDFTLQYRGDGEEIDIRERIIDILQTSHGEALGESVGAKFDYSDLINAAYVDNLANFVQTPFEVKITRFQFDGTKKVDWINPSPDTVNSLAVKSVAGVSDTFIVTQRPSQVAEFTVPSSGILRLGGFTANQEEVAYSSVAQVGDEYTFILDDGTSLAFSHAIDEPLGISVSDFDPDNVITNGIITDERTFRPFLGTRVVIEKLGS